MKTKTNNPKPMVVLNYPDGSKMELYVLDKGDTMPQKNSTNYEYHYEGPGIVVKNISGMVFQDEYYINDPELWVGLGSLMKLGIEYLKEHQDFEFEQYQNIAREDQK